MINYRGTLMDFRTEAKNSTYFSAALRLFNNIFHRENGPNLTRIF